MMIWMSLMRKLLAKGSLLSGLSMVATPQCTHLHGRGYMIFCVMLTIMVLQIQWQTRKLLKVYWWSRGLKTYLKVPKGFIYRCHKLALTVVLNKHRGLAVEVAVDSSGPS